jgi:hypothetical protein
MMDEPIVRTVLWHAARLSAFECGVTFEILSAAGFAPSAEWASTPARDQAAP